MGEIGATAPPPARWQVPKMLGIAVGWLALGHYASLYLWHLLPQALLDSLTLPVYSMICQVLTAAAGLGVSWAVLGRPREVLGARVPSRWDGAMTLLAAPLVFVLAS